MSDTVCGYKTSLCYKGGVTPCSVSPLHHAYLSHYNVIFGRMQTCRITTLHHCITFLFSLLWYDLSDDRRISSIPFPCTAWETATCRPTFCETRHNVDYNWTLPSIQTDE